MIHRSFVAIAFASLLVSACSRSSTSTPAPPAPHSAATPVADANAAVSRDAGSSAPSTTDADAGTPRGASVTFTGTAEGRGADPPIHEFAPRAVADAWHGSGPARIEIDADGTVRGSFTMSGLAMNITGRRAGDRVVATLHQNVGADSPPIAIEGVGDGGPPEGLFRGMLDGDVSGTTTLRGTWEASAGAGVHRRRGTFEAHATTAP